MLLTTTTTMSTTNSTSSSSIRSNRCCCRRQQQQQRSRRIMMGYYNNLLYTIVVSYIIIITELITMNSIPPSSSSNNMDITRMFQQDGCYCCSRSVNSVFMVHAVSPTTSSRRKQEQERKKRQQQGRNTNNKKQTPPKSNDYYAILGLKKNCTPKQIKSKYRKLALQYHPDKVSNTATDTERELAEQTFIQISHAYSVLSDPKKRSIYDQYGIHGLEAYERGHDPASAGFGFTGSNTGGGNTGNTGGFGGFDFNNFGSGQQQQFHFSTSGSNAGGSGGFGGFDAYKLFEDMFANTGGGGFPGGSSGGGGFQFGGSGSSSGHQRRTSQQYHRQQQQQQQQTPPKMDLFTKDTIGITKLGSPKFPNSSSKYYWLIVFYDSHDTTTSSKTEYAKSILDTIVSKSNHNNNNASFKIGAMDCTKNAIEKKFCIKHNVSMDSLPQYAFVIDGTVHFFDSDNSKVLSAKELYNFCIDHIQQSADTLIGNINQPSHLLDRLVYNHLILPSSTTFDKNNNKNMKNKISNKNISFLLLTDKYETSPIYSSIAYQYRNSVQQLQNNSKYNNNKKIKNSDIYIKFGISRAKNLKIAQMIGHVKKYPHFIAILSPSLSSSSDNRNSNNNNPYHRERLVLSTTPKDLNNNKHSDDSIEVEIIRYTGSMKSMTDITNWINHIIMLNNDTSDDNHRQSQTTKPGSSGRRNSNNNNNDNGYRMKHDRNEYGL